MQKAVQPSSFPVDNLKYRTIDEFENNKYKLVSILGAALMNKSIYGEKIA